MTDSISVSDPPGQSPELAPQTRFGLREHPNTKNDYRYTEIQYSDTDFGYRYTDFGYNEAPREPPDTENEYNDSDFRYSDTHFQYRYTFTVANPAYYQDYRPYVDVTAGSPVVSIRRLKMDQ